MFTIHVNDSSLESLVIYFRQVKTEGCPLSPSVRVSLFNSNLGVKGEHEESVALLEFIARAFLMQNTPRARLTSAWRENRGDPRAFRSD